MARTGGRIRAWEAFRGPPWRELDSRRKVMPVLLTVNYGEHLHPAASENETFNHLTT